jgi:hypothetical protein
MYALDVQVYLQHEIAWPLPRGERVIIGRDDAERVTAVVHWWQMSGPGRVKVLAAARSLHVREQGLGDEMLEELFSRLLEEIEDKEIKAVTVYCLVDWANEPCQKLLARNRFRVVHRAVRTRILMTG